MIHFARVSQETDTFNPFPSTLADFRRTVLRLGGDVLASAGQETVPGAFLAELRAGNDGSAVNPIVDAYATAGGRVRDEALRYFREQLVAGVRGAGRGDTIFLSLHGAFAAESCDSADSHLLRAVRAAAGRDPCLVLALDHHANITREMMAHADLVVGHDTQPHDHAATMRKAVRVWRRVRAGDTRPATAWRKIPMIAPQDRFLTTCPGPMKDWFDHARTWEQDARVLSVSPFPMQPWLDAEEGGWSVVAHTTGDQALADRIADESANLAWKRRDEFWISERVPPAQAVRVPRGAGLTVISDTGDAVLGGAPGDSTILLREIAGQRLPAIIYLPLADAAAVERAHRAGEGARVTMRVGGHAGGAYYPPLDVNALVRRVATDLPVKGPRGPERAGRAALLEIFGARVALLETASGLMVSPGLYEGLGLKMEDADAVVVKTGSNWQAFAPWQRRLVRADTAGVTQSRLQEFTWRRLPRPIYPLDEIRDWR